MVAHNAQLINYILIGTKVIINLSVTVHSAVLEQLSIY